MNSEVSLMKISTEIGSCARLVGEEKAVELVAKAGFDAWDFSMMAMCGYDWAKQCAVVGSHPLSGPDYLSFARKLKQIGLDNGIHCNQSHAPFPTRCPELRSYLKRSIECTAEAGGKICIIHPDNDSSPEENAQMYFELLPFARDCSVKIAAENMWNWGPGPDETTIAACATANSFRAHLDAVNDADFVACLDIGHAEMRGSRTSAVEMIEALGCRLQALHIHDNDKIHDCHQIPFTMNIDFLPIVYALRKNGYHGYFTLEADRFLDAYTPENAFDGIRKMAAATRKLADMFDRTAD